VVTHTRGRTTLTARHDYRDTDRVNTAGDAISALRNSAADRANQAKAKRGIKKRKMAQTAEAPNKVARRNSAPAAGEGAPPLLTVQTSTLPMPLSLMTAVKAGQTMILAVRP
jgi:hypothetical protein